MKVRLLSSALIISYIIDFQPRREYNSSIMTEKMSSELFIKTRASEGVEAATRAYFAADPGSMARMDKIMAVEEAQAVASLMGVKHEDIIRAYLRGTPEKFRQDYLDTIYDSGVIFGNDAVAIARDFGLISPTLGV